MIAGQKAGPGLNRGTAGRGRPAKGGATQELPKDDLPTLAEAGIDKKLSARAQKMAAVPEAKFESIVDENLCRAELSPADRARQTARRKAIYEELNPETKVGGIPGKAGGGKISREDRQVGDDGVVSRFTADTARLTGSSERTVQRDAERGEKVIAEVLDLIRSIDAVHCLVSVSSQSEVPRSLFGTHTSLPGQTSDRED